MKNFILGYTTNGKPVRITYAVATQTVAILARKDGGKTYAGMYLAENLLDAGVQVVVIEQVDKWWALRVGKNGRSKGKDIAVLGGKKGDEPLSPDAGKLVAKALVEGRISAVLVLTHMRKGQRRRFLADFGEELFHLKQQQEPATPMHLIIEEAQTVLPQMTRAGGPEENRMLGAFEDIVRIGRNAGIGVTMISQRPQSVNKEALSQTELLIALGVNEKPARKVIRDWVEEKGASREEVVDEMPGLAQGEAFVWSPSWLRFFGRVKIAERSTYDSTATVKLGRRRAVGKLPKSNRKRLRAAFKEATKLVEREDPTALKRRVAELEAEVCKHEQFVAKADVLTKRIDKRLDRMKPSMVTNHLGKRDVARLKKLVKTGASAEKLGESLKWLAEVVEKAGATFVAGAKELNLKLSVVNAPAPTAQKPIEVSRNDTVVAGLHKRGVPLLVEKNGGALNEYAQALLKTMAQRHPTVLTTSQIALLSGRSPKSSAFSGAMAKLKIGGLIFEAQRGRYTLSDSGRRVVGAVEPPQSGDELRAHWLRVLDDYPRDLFKVAVEAYPEEVTREELAQRSGKSIKSSAFSGAISTLLKNELFEITSPGTVRASSTLF